MKGVVTQRSGIRGKITTASAAMRRRVFWRWAETVLAKFSSPGGFNEVISGLDVPLAGPRLEEALLGLGPAALQHPSPASVQGDMAQVQPVQLLLHPAPLGLEDRAGHHQARCAAGAGFAPKSPLPDPTSLMLRSLSVWRGERLGPGSGQSAASWPRPTSGPCACPVDEGFHQLELHS